MTLPSPRASRAPEPQDAKAQLRASLRKARQHRSQRRNDEVAVTLRDLVLTMPAIDSATCVSVYASRPHEPGTGPLIEALHERGVRILIPRLGDGLQRGWSEYQGAEDLMVRAPGRPPEPSGDFLPQSALAQAQVVIVPALAVDSHGTRLGQGGGWYDRALEDTAPGTPIIALAYTAEYHGPDAPALPQEAHDIAVHTVITPEGITDLPA